VRRKAFFVEHLSQVIIAEQVTRLSRRAATASCQIGRWTPAAKSGVFPLDLPRRILGGNIQTWACRDLEFLLDSYVAVRVHHTELRGGIRSPGKQPDDEQAD
jgi:hypothetical protein